MYNDPMRGLDAWLERPYQDMIEDQDRFVDWAEEEGYDLDDPTDAKEAEKAYEDYLAGEAEDHDLALYEAHLDRLEMEAEEREYDENW